MSVYKAPGQAGSTAVGVSIDNTPELSVSVNGSEGDMEIGGSVDFKEHVGGIGQLIGRDIVISRLMKELARCKKS